jgi:hypothetical protein
LNVPGARVDETDFMSEPEIESENRAKSGAGRGCLGLILLVGCYLLSPGLFILLDQRMPPSVRRGMDSVFEVLYWPLFWCCEQIPAVRAFYDWYEALFDF